MALRDLVRFNSLIERADRFFGSYNAAPLYYDVAFRVASSWGVSCFNYGYAPLSPERASATDCVEPYQLEMYAQAASDAGLDGFRGATVLEISCGMGGGLAHLSRTLGIGTAVALDRAMPGVRSAHGRFGLSAVKADAVTLPVASRSVDVVLNVEASHVYWGDAFLSEVARVLRPGGRFVLVDSRDLSVDGVRAYLNEPLLKAGLRLQRVRDVTANVIASCVADSPRREALLAKVPFFVRPSMRPMLGIEGTSRYECFRSGKTTYFIAVASIL